MGAPIMPPGPRRIDKSLREGLYISRWQEPGRAEADFGRLDAKTVVRNFGEEDLAAYGALYEKSGFGTALQVPYRAIRDEFAVSDPVVKAPALLIRGGKDYSSKFPGIEVYISSGKVKEFAPNLEIVFLPEGTHFVQKQ
ncbi:hypothetical protein DVH24_017193 [Malus domestica]|uniref:AB hydrolase-1 domain-containing protein n=1 Tax=Malus domestica TaxID=3750 RepID=A0A498ISA3_MALDO|nr:hypothetical protein DVH24_017193 [Malus domestica]